MVVEDRIEKEKARRKAEQEAEELRAAIKVSVRRNVANIETYQLNLFEAIIIT